MADQARCKKCKFYYILEGVAKKITLKSKKLKCPSCGQPLVPTSYQCKDLIHHLGNYEPSGEKTANARRISGVMY